jgi:DNA-binding GntR family transcriptional regulator
MSKKIEHLSLAEQVYHLLLDQIINGKLSEGTKLSEESICSDFGVSRTPAREALLMLDRDKLIDRIARRGCFVRKFDNVEIAELFECRRMLECLMLDQGFKNIQEKELLKLKKILETSGASNRKKSLAVDEKLHELIIASCSNQHLQEIVRQIIKRIQPLRSWRTFNVDDIKKITNERLGIINALLKREKEKAIQLLGEHISKGAMTIGKKKDEL